MTRTALPLLLGATLCVGCAHLRSTDRLDEARGAYEKAQQGPAAASSPADLATAKKFLDAAEKGLETGDPKVVDDRATIALLKIQAAEALGLTVAATMAGYAFCLGHLTSVAGDRTGKALLALRAAAAVACLAVGTAWIVRG